MKKEGTKPYLGKVRFVRRRNTTTPVRAWTPMGGGKCVTVRLFASRLHTNSYTALKWVMKIHMVSKMQWWAFNSRYAKIFTVLISKDFNFCPLFLPTTKAYVTSPNSDFASIYLCRAGWIFFFFLRKGGFFWCNLTYFWWNASYVYLVATTSSALLFPFLETMLKNSTMQHLEGYLK